MSNEKKLFEGEYEILNEIIQEPSCIYDDEEEILRNFKIIKALKIKSVIILILVFICLTISVGFVQMKMYGVNNTVVTTSVIKKVNYLNVISDYNDGTDGAYEYCKTFVDIFTNYTNQTYQLEMLETIDEYYITISSYSKQVPTDEDWAYLNDKLLEALSIGYYIVDSQLYSNNPTEISDETLTYIEQYYMPELEKIIEYYKLNISDLS